jgi:glycosyltransferase involved in cell wall biosynthesis
VKLAVNLEAAGWLGGRYYLSNLMRALRSLGRTDLELVAVGGEDTFDGADSVVASVPADADVVFPNWGLSGRPTVTEMHWIPDLQHRQLPGNFGMLERARRDRGYRRLARRAAVVVVSSDAVAADVATSYPRAAAKVRVVHFASVPASDVAPVDATLEKYDLPEAFVLLPNQFWAHKNHATAFAAAADLPLPLVCTGAMEDHRRPGFRDELMRLLDACDSRARVRILGVVPRPDYLALVAGATALLQPSLFEGWSSTVEDARAFGRPIALSDIPVHREQDPPGGVFFDPLSPTALASAVTAACALAPVPAAEAARLQHERVVAYGERFLAVAGEAMRAAR